MALTEKRKGELAYLFLKENVRKEGMRRIEFTNEMIRENGNRLKAVNARAEKPVSASEFEEFAIMLYGELLSEATEDLKKIAEQGESK